MYWHKSELTQLPDHSSIGLIYLEGQQWVGLLLSTHVTLLLLLADVAHSTTILCHRMVRHKWKGNCTLVFYLIM